MDRVISILASAIVDVVEFRRVWDRINPIPRNTTDKCSEQNPKIGPLTDLHTRWHSSYFSSTKRSSYKNLLQYHNHFLNRLHAMAESWRWHHMLLNYLPSPQYRSVQSLHWQLLYFSGYYSRCTLDAFLQEKYQFLGTNQIEFTIGKW